MADGAGATQLDPTTTLDGTLAALASGESATLHRRASRQLLQIGRWGQAARHAARAAELAGADAIEWSRVAELAARSRAADVLARCLEALGERPDVERSRTEALCDSAAAAALDCARRHEWSRLAQWPALIDRLDHVVPGRGPVAALRALLAARAGESSARDHARAAGAGCTSADQASALADHLRYHHRFDLATALLDAARQRWPEDRRLWLDAGNVAAERGDLRGALACWERVLDDPHLGGDARHAAIAARCALDRRSPTTAEIAALAPPMPRELEVGPDPFTAAELAAVLRRHGCAVVRGGLPQRDCQALLPRLEHNLAHAYVPNQPPGDPTELNVPLHFFCDRSETAALAARFAEIREQPIAAWHWGLDGVVSTADVWLRIAGLTTVIDAISLRLGGALTIDRSLGYARAKLGSQQRVLPFHQDARTGYWEIPTIAMWMPLVPCGEDAPGLEIVPRRLRSLFPVGLYGGSDRTDYQAYPASALDELIPSWTVVAPVLAPGDILLFDSYVLHRTQRISGCEGRRVNFDVRFTLAVAPPELPDEP